MNSGIDCIPVHFLDLLFPPFCQRCNKLGSWYCSKCLNHISWCEQPEIVPSHGYPSLRRVWSVCEYDEVSGDLIQKLKYSNQRILGHVLAQPMAALLSPQIARWKIECLVPVPLHRKRMWQRGFNQSESLAQGVSALLKIPTDDSLLKRVIWHETQAQQGRDGRHKLQYMFRACHRAPYTTVCLVDDVFTTGSTLSACARALNQAGVRTVLALTFSRAQ